MGDLLQDGETSSSVVCAPAELTTRPTGPDKCHFDTIACHDDALWWRYDEFRPSRVDDRRRRGLPSLTTALFA
jgi:hypothetical protein